ncbi:MAG TPA: hypothetical protein VMW16_04675 [Sedimentisphaerales bacterium]|nr:hypothetical protein [Sedimentisphaerales bacterium]
MARSSQKGKSRRTYWALALVAGVVLACGVVYVVRMGRYGGAVPFGRDGFNTTREAEGKKKWAQRLGLSGGVVLWDTGPDVELCADCGLGF